MANLKQHADGSVGIYNDQEGFSVFFAGGPKNPATGSTSSSSATNNASAQHKYHPKTTIVVPLFNGTANVTGSLGVWVNPYNETLLVTNTQIVVSPGQAQTFNISVGTGALSAGLVLPSAVPLGNNLIDTANYNGGKAKAAINNIDSNGSNGKRSQFLGPGQAIIVTEVSSGALSTAGLTLYADIQKR